MKDSDGYRIIDAGIESNILVYDINATVGYLTKHLMFHIKRLVPRITNILVPTAVFYEFIPTDWVPPLSNCDKSPADLFCFGIKIDYDERLDSKGVWTDYYIKRNGHLARGDEYLILGYEQQSITTSIFPNFTKDNVVLASC